MVRVSRQPSSSISYKLGSLTARIPVTLKAHLRLSGGGWQILLGEERDRGSRAAQREDAALEVNDAQVPLQHVQPKQKFHVARLCEVNETKECPNM